MSCDDYCCNYGCNQGRNCPARRRPVNTPKPVAAWRINLRGKYVTWVLKRQGFIRIGRLMLRWGEA